MIGELIPTGYTYDQGRIALNDSFSASGYFNNIEASGNISGSTFYSGNTNLYDIFCVDCSGFSGLTASSGFHSIIANNSSTNIASGLFSIALHENNKAFGRGAFSIGNNTTASGAQSFAGGESSSASGSSSFSFGISTIASGQSAYAGGIRTISNEHTEWARSSDGDYGQFGYISLFNTTVNDTATELFTDGGSLPRRFSIPTNSTYRCTVSVVGSVEENNAQSGSSIEFKGECLIKNVGDTVTLVGTASTINLTSIFSDTYISGLGTVSSSLSADDTNKTIKIEVQGSATDIMYWFAKLEYVKVLF